MPSWGIHLATANEILDKIDIQDKNSFLMGNFIPDAERYVISDFSLFEEFLVKTNSFEFPIYEEKLFSYINDIDEIRYNSSDFIKIVDFLNNRFIKKELEISDGYSLYTLEQMKKDFDDSIEFIVNFLKNNNIVK